MNKKRKILILVVAIVFLSTAVVGILLWRADADQPALDAPVPAVEDSIFDDEDQMPSEDAMTSHVEQQPQDAAQEGDLSSGEPLEGKPDVEPSTPDAPLPAPGELSYADYNAMSAASQRAYMESFENVEDFFDWYYDAKDAYDAAQPDIDVGDGVIDLEDLMQDE